MALQIIILHGLGGTMWSLQPMEAYLNRYGYPNTHILGYPSRELTINESIENIAAQMKDIITEDDEIIVIGQSLGGVIAMNLHKYGFKIKLVIAIVAPLKGARMINNIPQFIQDNFLPTKAHNELKNMQNTEYDVPHVYKTISTSYPLTTFDGCVYVDETYIDPDNHVHISYGDHRTIFVDLRLLKTVWNMIEESK